MSEHCLDVRVHEFHQLQADIVIGEFRGGTLVLDPYSVEPPYLLLCGVSQKPRTTIPFQELPPKLQAKAALERLKLG